MIYRPAHPSDLNGILQNNPTAFRLLNSTVDHGLENISFLVDHKRSDYWCSRNEKWSYFEVVFSDFYVSLESYSVQVGAWGSPNNYPKQWTASAFDGNNWFNISTVINSELNIGLKIKNFETDNRNYFKRFRFTHTGINYRGYDYFCLMNFEVFGKTSKAIIQNIECRRKITNFFLFGLLFIIK